MNRLSFTIAALFAAGTFSAFAEDNVELDLVVNNQVRKVVILLNNEAAPKTCENFRQLAKSGFYKGLAVHRAIPKYLVQMGDPYTRDDSQKALWGTGGPEHTVPAEIGLPHIRGAVAMARLPDSRNPSRASNGSQFYIVLDDLDHLNGQYTVFGRVTRGIEHLDYISEQTVDTNDAPIHRIEIASVSVNGVKASPDVLTPVTAAASSAGAAVRNAGSSIASATDGGVREASGKMLGAAAGGVRSAGEKVAGVIPDHFSMPKMPNFGRGEEEDPAGEKEISEIPVVESPAAASENDDVEGRKHHIPLPSLSGLPKPKMPNLGFGRSKDAPAEEVAVAEESSSEPLAPAIQPAIISEDRLASAPEEDSAKDGKRKKMSIPVPKDSGEEEDGRLNRMIKRIW